MKLESSIETRMQTDKTKNWKTSYYNNPGKDDAGFDQVGGEKQ